MIGQFRTRVTFQNNDPTVLGAGKKDSYTTLLSTWGRLEKTNGDRTMEGLQMVLTSTHNLWVREQEVLTTGLKKNTRVLINSKSYAIASYELIGQKQFFYKFKLKESE